ncbi:GtrA family protein [Nocardia beijingensis]|uniref:GtrA family protein n=1 Tax=Nocardia beijingensis TaxID=95162 RepID=UPI0018961B6D|nr:GtrA family protein [Nocardia beijingensis]MBF6077225.1 GtrA family protein [Nocardia beijingensis]
MHELSETADTIADRFTRWCAAIAHRLPFGLNRLVPPTFLGFALINSGTFAVDLALLTVLHGWLDLPVWSSVTVAYVCAFGLAFVLNRTFNFHSHAPVGKQAAVYVAVVVVNYLAFILGIGSGLTALGLEYHVSRLLAGACEAVYMYSAMRWVVFRRAVEPEPELAPDAR